MASSKFSPWPPEVLEVYKPVQHLGKGGFASVLLARHQDHGMVAIKRVGSSTTAERGYAHREVDILSQLPPHRHMVRLIDSFRGVIVLSYAQGPTLEKILQQGGAPKLLFGRVICAQLVDVVAHLHSHAVLHRDIKPDNMVITMKDPEEDIWDESDENNTEEPNWTDLNERWHLTLVDFGFARALQSDDVKTDIGLHAVVHKRNSMVEEMGSDTRNSVDRPLQDTSRHGNAGKSRSDSEKLSASRHIVRQMSALGHRNFAAPEIINKVQESSEHGDLDSSSPMQTLSRYVSNYGMVADAFSVGSTIRYTLTGVPPNEKVQDAIAAQNHPVALLCRCTSELLKGEKQPRKRYRSAQKLPAEAARLIKGMTHYDARQRTTCRAARGYPWIDDVLPKQDNPEKNITFLPCATKAEVPDPTIAVEDESVDGKSCDSAAEGTRAF